MADTKKYKVLEEFTLPVVQEVGSVVELTAEQANSGEYGSKIEPVTENENEGGASVDPE